MEHSLSPTMHNAAFQKLDLNFVYVAFRVRQAGLREAIIGAKRLGIHGLNVTMPHKQPITRYLDELTPEARSIGAVNTVLSLDERFVGYNTDGLGALRALWEHGVSLRRKRLLLLGAGGAGRAIAFHAAPETEELVILNRTVEKAEVLAAFLRERFDKKVTANRLLPEVVEKELSNSDVLINATSIGMHPQADRSLISPSWMKSELCVMDTVYSPLETELLKNAKSAGAKTVSGVDMLVHQGAASFEIWTKQPAPIQTMKQAVWNKLSESRGSN